MYQNNAKPNVKTQIIKKFDARTISPKFRNIWKAY